MTGLVVGIPSIKNLMKIINEFKIYSGLGVNEDKTEDSLKKRKTRQEE